MTGVFNGTILKLQKKKYDLLKTLGTFTPISCMGRSKHPLRPISPYYTVLR
jgi:hypothetical protein